MNGLERFADFRRLWDLGGDGPALHYSHSPILVVYHPTYGQMHFISTRIPQYYTQTRTLEITLYVPTKDSEVAWRKLRDETANDITFLQ